MQRLIAAFAALLVSIAASHAQNLASAPSPEHGQSLPTLAPLVKSVAPAVVSVAVKGRVAMEQNPLLNDPSLRKFFNVPQGQVEQEIHSAGSGVVIDPRQGLIVTNHHVVEHADEIVVRLHDGRRLNAQRVGSDPDTDLAVIRVPPDKELATIPLGDSNALQVGDYVIAIGNPFGIGQTVTHGIVSAVRRSGLSDTGFENFIQTDAPINPGNSGGALVNLKGELVGINEAIIGPSGGSVGIGFATPVSTVRQVTEQLVRYGRVRHGHLGVGLQDLTPDLARQNGLPAEQSGALIASVEAASPADRAGLKAGDVVTAVGSTPIDSAADLRSAVGLMTVGDVIELKVLRDGQAKTINATAASR
jgi:Do/DeqQ family serine protease